MRFRASRRRTPELDRSPDTAQRCDDARVLGPRDQRLADRLTHLARVTSELVRADTVDAVAKTVVTHGAEAVGATTATMTLLTDDRQMVRLVALSGGLPG